MLPLIILIFSIGDSIAVMFSLKRISEELNAVISPVAVIAPVTVNAPVAVAPLTVKVLKVPTDVIALCAAVVTVPAVVAVDALPVKAPTNVVDVTEVNPAIVVDVAPNAVEVEPIVIELFAKLAFDIEPANIEFVTFAAPIVVAFPTEVISPVKFALVVTFDVVNKAWSI